MIRTHYLGSCDVRRAFWFFSGSRWQSLLPFGVKIIGINRISCFCPWTFLICKGIFNSLYSLYWLSLRLLDLPLLIMMMRAQFDISQIDFQYWAFCSNLNSLAIHLLALNDRLNFEILFRHVWTFTTLAYLGCLNHIFKGL